MLDFVPDISRDVRFFGLYETVFLLYVEKHGEEEALEFMHELFSRALKPAYDQMNFAKGNAYDFARCVGERDKSVGLHVRFPKISADRIVYEFHTDPFPNLKGYIDPRRFDAAYMNFKIAYLLGEDWSYETPEHIWENGEFTRHIITKSHRLGMKIPAHAMEEIQAVV
ncbi:MAG: hypothetical protein HY514_01080 [Candidatus Aenigmarchaeota archaeon]|nr:hypothetical protein [Candidatus Aenigmarchaeota archaeon]